MKEAQQKVIENYVDSYNAFDTSGMIKNLHEDVIFENYTSGKVDLRTDGKEAFAQQSEIAKQYFSHRKQTIKSWQFDDAQVTIQIDYEGILAIDLPNGMKSGETLKLQGKSIFEFKDGKIYRIRDSS